MNEIDTEHLVWLLTILTAKFEDDNLSEDDIVNILVELDQLEIHEKNNLHLCIDKLSALNCFFPP